MVPGQGREGGWARGPRSLHVKRKSLQPLHSSTTIKARVGRYQAETFDRVWLGCGYLNQVIVLS